MFAQSSLPWTPLKCKIEFLPARKFHSESKVEVKQERDITERCGSAASPKQRNILWNASLSPPSLTFFFSLPIFPQRCDDNIAELLLALTTVGRQPRRRDGPGLCRSTVHPLWCLITQKMWKQGQWTGNAKEKSRVFWEQWQGKEGPDRE